MKIALVGYGKMGQIIDKIAQTRGHEIVARLNESPTLENLNNPDVVIEFSSPESAFGNKIPYSNNLQFQNSHDEGKTRSGVKVDIGGKNLYSQRNQ